MLDQQVKPWAVTDAAELYDVGRWGVSNGLLHRRIGGSLSGGATAAGAGAGDLIHPDRMMWRRAAP